MKPCPIRCAGMTTIVLRLAKLGDSENLYRWRNHPLIRAKSHQTDAIERERHETWLRETLANPNRILLIGESIQDGQTKAVGVLRYDLSPNGESAVVSIYLVPEHLGKGLGTSLLLTGTEWVLNNQPNLSEILAEIRKDNIPSQKVFVKAGYIANECKKPDFLHYTFWISRA